MSQPPMNPKYSVLVSALVGVAIGLTACPQNQAPNPSALITPSTSPSPAASPSSQSKPVAPAPLTVQKLKNAQYYILSNEPTPLQDGQYENKQKQKFKLDEVVTYSDLNKDSFKDAVGSITIDRDGRSFTYLVVVTNDRGNPKNIASEFLGEGVTVKELSASPETITVKLDKACCPKQEITRSYSLKDIKPASPAPAKP